MKKSNGNIEVSTRDPLDGSYSFGFLVWSGLLRDFALSQRGILRSSRAKKMLRAQFVTAASGSVVNMENDVRRHTSEIYLPVMGQEFDNSPSLSSDVYGEIIVS